MINYDIRLRVAATQMEPVWYNAHETITKMIRMIREASANDAKLVAFGECMVPGYMYHVWTDMMWEGHAKYDVLLMQNSIEVDGPEMRRLMQAARDNRIYVVTGYKAEQFVALAEKHPNVHLVHNAEYATKNNINSVAVVADKMASSDCFVCEADLFLPRADVLCRELPRYKRPRKIIFADVPRNHTGKIEKPKLRKMYGGESLVAAQNKA